MTAKPQVSFWQIWNMCFGFLGIQFGFALQNANVSRIFQTLGAQVDEIPILWIAAPLTGLIVQPIVGVLLGPYVESPRPPPAVFSWRRSADYARAVCDAEFSVAVDRRGTAVDSRCIAQHFDGTVPRVRRRSAVAAATPDGLCNAELLHRHRCGRREPSALAARGAGVQNSAEPGGIPDTVKYAFYAGGAVLFLAVGWTVLSTREYPPAQLNSFDDANAMGETGDQRGQSAPRRLAVARGRCRCVGCDPRRRAWRRSSTCWRQGCWHMASRC